MKHLLLPFVFTVACSTHPHTFARDLKPCQFFTLPDAEKIIGKAKQTGELTETKDTGNILRCTYTAIEKINGHDTNLFLVVELAKNETAAKLIYTSLKKANEDLPGLEDISDLGDEAYFHTDGENFYFILVRKGDKLVRMKLNKITKKTSPVDLKAAAKFVIEKL